MKRIIFAALILLAPSAAFAQRDDQFVFGIGGGATLLSGLAHDTHDTGVHGTLSWGIGMVDSPWGIRFDASYAGIGDRTRLVAIPDQAAASAAAAAVPQGDARIFSLTGNVVFNVYGSNTHLYALGGLGGYWYNPDGDGTQTKNDLTLQGGLGVYIPKFHGFIEAKMVNLYRALPNPDTGVHGKKSARLYPITLGILF